MMVVGGGENVQSETKSSGMMCQAGSGTSLGDRMAIERQTAI